MHMNVRKHGGNQEKHWKILDLEKIFLLLSRNAFQIKNLTFHKENIVQKYMKLNATR